MSSEFKILLKNMIFNDFIIGLISCIILFAFWGIKFMSIFLIGLAVAIINFVVSGIILETTLNPKKKKNRFYLPITYIARIIFVILFAIPFISEFKSVLAYLLGFTIHFPILILSWFKSQKGSE